MFLIVRSLAASITFLSTLLFGYWMSAALLTLAGASEEIALVASAAISVITAQAAARWVWRNAGLPGFLRTVALSAMLTGAVGFVLGFVGPLVFTPESNQGPLLGLFITGPLGVVLGAIGGVVYWMWRRPRAVAA